MKEEEEVEVEEMVVVVVKDSEMEEFRRLPPSPDHRGGEGR